MEHEKDDLSNELNQNNSHQNDISYSDDFSELQNFETENSINEIQ